MFENGPQVLQSVIIQIPELTMSFIDYIVKHYAQGTKNKLRINILTMLLDIHPNKTRHVIELLSKKKFDCNFVCRLAVERLSDLDLIEFLEPVQATRDSPFSQIVLRSSGRQVLPLLIERVLKIVRSVIDKTSESLPPVAYAPWCTRLCRICVELLNTSEKWKDEDVVTITRFVFRTTLDNRNDEKMEIDTSFDGYGSSSNGFYDSSIVFDSQESQSEQISRKRQTTETSMEESPFGDAHETFVLASLVAIPFFTQFPLNQTAAVQPPDHSVYAWLSASRRRTFDFAKNDLSFGKNLLFVHACILSGKTDELSEFASEILKRKVEITHRHLHAQVLKNAFMSRCLSETEIAKRCANQPITKGLRETSGGRLAIHSLAALQAAGVFKTFKIDISGWLERQLMEISYPASEILSEVIEIFAINTVSRKTGLSKEFINETFSGDVLDQKKLLRRVYVMLYLCSYREHTQRHDPSLRSMIYGEEFYTKLPIRYLMTVMESRHEDFEHIRAKVIARCGNLFPYMMPTAKSLLLAQKYNNSKVERSVSFSEIDVQKMVQTVRCCDGIKAINILKKISKASLGNQIAAMPVMLECFMKSLEAEMPEGADDIILGLFDTCEQICPRALYEAATSRWIAHEEHLTIAEIYKIPALIFRVDSRILSSVMHFECFIRTLRFFADAVRWDLRLKMIMTNAKNASIVQQLKQSEEDRREKELLTSAYIDSQHSVLIHAIIEVCDPKRMKDDPTDFAMIEKRKQIRKIAYDYLHRVFIDHDGLLKVVLTQKFPLRQIRAMVEGIPSLFVSNSHIYELIMPPDPQRRIFTVVLVAELSRKYRVKECLDTARLVCDIVHSLHKFGQLPASSKLWKHVAPALIILATEFPSLTDSITRLLCRVLANARNRLAVRYRLLSGDPKHEEHELINMITTFLDRDKKPANMLTLRINDN
ncbi:unnamed protein product [Caenorhabditis bovis]|uniref:Uncharacterized protein n=1 Tax=Caenorhabditis bovis TaxID=2654633 RepID=A0A8S1EAH1_9PELO|nr:unnamed protein product [Caenorhabditis bovis]